MIKNIFLNNLSQSLQFGSRWLFNLSLLRIINVEEFAIFSFLYSISNILVAIYPFGSSVYIFKESKKIENKKLIIESIYIIIVFFILSLIIMFISNIFNLKIKGIDFLIYSILLGFFLSINLVLSSYIKSLEYFNYDLIGNLIFSILLMSFVVIVFFIKKVTITLIFQYLILINIIVMLFFFKKLSLKINVDELYSICSINNIKKSFKERLYYGLQEIQTAIYAQGNMIVLFFILSTQLYGIYRSLFIIIMPINLVTVSMTQVFIIHLKKQTSKLKLEFRKICLYSIIFAIFIFIIYCCLSSYLLNLIKLNFHYIKEYLILALSISIKIIMIPYIAFLVVQNKQKVRFYANFIGSLFMLFSIFIFVSKTGILEAILIYTVSIIIICFIKIIFTEKELKKL